jgi:hypothetical protein
VVDGVDTWKRGDDVKRVMAIALAVSMVGACGSPPDNDSGDGPVPTTASTPAAGAADDGPAETPVSPSPIVDDGADGGTEGAATTTTTAPATSLPDLDDELEEFDDLDGLLDELDDLLADL